MNKETTMCLCYFLRRERHLEEKQKECFMFEGSFSETQTIKQPDISSRVIVLDRSTVPGLIKRFLLTFLFRLALLFQRLSKTFMNGHIQYSNMD